MPTRPVFSQRRRRGALWRWLGVLALLVVAVVAGVSVYVGCSLSPARRLPVDATPAALGLAFEAVEFPATDGLVLRGWFLPAARAGAAPVAPEGGVAEGAENVPAPSVTGGVSPYTIIFAPGFRSNRLERGEPAPELARSFVNACFHGLLFAFRNHGGS